MSPVKRSEGRVSETEGKVRIPSSLDSLSLLKGLCHEDTGRAVSPLSFNPVPYLPSLALDGRKQFQCLNLGLYNKT